MTESDDPKSDEIVVRVISRLPVEMPGNEFARLDIDEEDFLRRRKYGGVDVPEPGISLMRRNKFNNLQDIFERIGIRKKALGAAQTLWIQLSNKNLKFKLSGDKQEHISLRCETCDFGYEKSVHSCNTKGSTSYDDCPLFAPNLLKLEREFTLIEKAEMRSQKL